MARIRAWPKTAAFKWDFDVDGGAGSTALYIGFLIPTNAVYVYGAMKVLETITGTGNPTVEVWTNTGAGGLISVSRSTCVAGAVIEGTDLIRNMTESIAIGRAYVLFSSAVTGGSFIYFLRYWEMYE